MLRRKVLIRPRADTDGVDERDGILFVSVKAPARDNKANVSMVKVLSRHFKRNVRIVSGLKRREKVVEIGDER